MMCCNSGLTTYSIYTFLLKDFGKFFLVSYAFNGMMTKNTKGGDCCILCWGRRKTRFSCKISFIFLVYFPINWPWFYVIKTMIYSTNINYVISRGIIGHICWLIFWHLIMLNRHACLLTLCIWNLHYSLTKVMCNLMRYFDWLKWFISCRLLWR